MRYLSKFRDTLGGCNRVSSEMHLEAIILQTWSPSLCDFGDTLAGSNRTNLKTQCMRWWSELRDRLRACDQAKLEIHLEAVIEHIWG